MRSNADAAEPTTQNGIAYDGGDVKTVRPKTENLKILSMDSQWADEMPRNIVKTDAKKACKTYKHSTDNKYLVVNTFAATKAFDCQYLEQVIN